MVCCDAACLILTSLTATHRVTSTYLHDTKTLRTNSHLPGARRTPRPCHTLCKVIGIFCQSKSLAAVPQAQTAALCQPSIGHRMSPDSTSWMLLFCWVCGEQLSQPLLAESTPSGSSRARVLQTLKPAAMNFPTLLRSRTFSRSDCASLSFWPGLVASLGKIMRLVFE